MKLYSVKKFFLRHPALSFFIVTCILYSVYRLWDHGYLAITRTQKIEVLVRRMRYYEGYRPDIPVLGSHNPDKSIIPQAEALGNDAVPYLAKELRTGDRHQVEAAVFLLANAIRTKLSLSILAEACRDGLSNPFAFRNAIGPAGLENRFLSDKELSISDYDRWKECFRLRYYEWYNRFKDRVVDTDYGIGVMMPDNTTRPLSYHGIDVGISEYLGKTHDFTIYYFCSERRVKYFDNYTTVYHALSDILKYDAPDKWGEYARGADFEQAEKDLFFRLFSERVQTDPTFWPYYPVMRYGVVQGYFDSEHRRHGLWRDINDESKSITRERWFFHGEELSEEEYYARGGYDMAISLPWSNGNPAPDKASTE